MRRLGRQTFTGSVVEAKAGSNPLRGVGCPAPPQCRIEFRAFERPVQCRIIEAQVTGLDHQERNTRTIARGEVNA